jgi:hypothetical protein
MSAWSPALRWFMLRALLLLATLLAPGCGYVTYNVPLAELQRLSHLPPSQRGNHVRVYTPGLVPVATPEVQVAAAPSAAPPGPPSVPPALPDAMAASEPIDLPTRPEVFDQFDSQSDPLAPPAFVSVNLAPPVPTPRPALPLRVRPAPMRIPLPAAGRPSVPPASLGHISAPRALPVHGAAYAVHGVGGPHHWGGTSVSHHSGGGGGGAAVSALVGAVVVVGLMVAIAEASEPTPFDGWVRTSSDHVLQLAYPSGPTREVRLCDLKPADTIGVRSALLYSTGGLVERIESATSIPSAAPPPRLTTPPTSVPVPPPRPAATPSPPSPTPPFTSHSNPSS